YVRTPGHCAHTVQGYRHPLPVLQRLPGLLHRRERPRRRPQRGPHRHRAMIHAGFLAEILERPEDDAPRLVYADWLEDNGDPDRAEFIRAQCERARLPAGDQRHAALLRREEVLLRRNRKAWLAELPRLDGGWWQELGRGWGARARFATAAAFLRHAPAVLAAAPVEAVRVLSLGDDLWDVGREAALRLASRLREVDLSETGLSAVEVGYLVDWAPP